MAIETLRPNAGGTNTELNYYDGATHAPDPNENYKQIDEETTDEMSTFVYNPTTGGAYKKDTYAIPNHSEGSGTINSVKVYHRHTYDKAKACIRTHGTDYYGSEFDNDVWTTNSYTWTINPYTASTWTWDEVDDLEIGVALARDDNSNAVRCTQVYVEVDYTSVTEKTSSDAGSGVDAYVSLQTPQAKLSSDAGSGADAKASGNPAANLIKTESGAGIEALFTRLLAAFDTGYGAEVSSVVTDGQLKNLFAAELGQGSDYLTAKIEMPTKGGGMKLWT